MDYEIVQLEEKTLVGLTARTNNQSPDMNRVIGQLWGRLYGEGVYEAIPQKKTGKVIGLYSDYAGDETGDYSITTGCEVEAADQLPDGAVVRHIPAGTYATFVVEGELHAAVAGFWTELWGMKLNRAFTCDFEEYQTKETEHAVIHIYISLR